MSFDKLQRQKPSWDTTRHVSPLPHLKFHNTVRFRMITMPVEVFRVFEDGTSYLVDADYMNKPHEKPATVRYAFLVIDRQDSQVKIAEVGVTVLKQIKFICDQLQIKPTDTNGCDFMVTRSGTGLATRYQVNSQASVMTTAEQELVAKPPIDIAAYFSTQTTDGSVEKVLSVTVYRVDCPECNGSGRKKGTTSTCFCRRCEGTGRLAYDSLLQNDFSKFVPPTVAEKPKLGRAGFPDVDDELKSLIDELKELDDSDDDDIRSF